MAKEEKGFDHPFKSLGKPANLRGMDDGVYSSAYLPESARKGAEDNADGKNFEGRGVVSPVTNQVSGQSSDEKDMHSNGASSGDRSRELPKPSKRAFRDDE